MELSRREVVKSAGALTALAAVSNFSFVAGKASAADAADSTKPLRIAVIGCGGRGTGAVEDAISSSKNVILVAMADLDAAPLKDCYNSLILNDRIKANIQVKPENMFTGYDAIDKVCSHPEVDLVIQTTPPGLRYLTFRKAVENGKHSFVEKPVCVDAFTYNHVLETGKMAEAKGLAAVCGLQYRREYSYMAWIEQIKNGAIGEIVSAQSYYQSSIPWLTRPWADLYAPNQMDYQLRNWLHYTWLAGDFIAEQDVHSIDAILWALGSHPVSAYANGGRQEPLRGGMGDGFDSFSVDYTFKNKEGQDLQVAFYGRQINGVENKVYNRIVGTKGYATIKPNPGESKGLIFEHGKSAPIWKYEGEMNAPYETEHAENIAAIRAGKPLNDIPFVAESSFTAVLGRESAYSGKTMMWDKLVASNFRTGTDKLAPGKVELPIEGVRVPGQYQVPNYK